MITGSTRALAPAIIVAAAIGLTAALALLWDTLALLADPTAAPPCDISPLIGCGASIGSEQGSLLGFPNSVLGVVFWSGMLATGLAAASGIQAARWFRLATIAAVAGAFGLVVWFIVQSIFVLGVLCPWCMLTWSVTIPLFLLVFLDGLATGVVPAPASLRRRAVTARGWIPLLTIFLLLVIAALAQWRLDLLGLLLS